MKMNPIFMIDTILIITLLLLGEGTLCRLEGRNHSLTLEFKGTIERLSEVLTNL